jgi:probable rRNA maturation factor
LKIKIFYDEVKYRLRESRKALKMIEKVIRNEKQIPGDLCFIITSDKKLIEINREFLDHDFFTDVIAFSNKEQKYINGEIYISIDTVKINALNYKVSLRCELLRVMIHGTLHLCGYNDKTKKQKAEMRKKEEKWLSVESEK